MTLLNAAVLISGLYLLSISVCILWHHTKGTRLRGPSSKSLIFSNSHFLRQQKDITLVYEEWAEQYGGVFCTPIALGMTQVILCDPKAIQHFYSKETYGYIQNAISRFLINNMIGKGLLWAEGDNHKRQRKTLTPAFGTASIQKLIPIFFDLAYKVKEAWDALLESSENDKAVIDMHAADLVRIVAILSTNIGTGSFSHDFGTLQHQHSTITKVFTSFGKLKPTFLKTIIFLLSTVLPILACIPSPRRTLEKKFKSAAEEILRELLNKSREEKVAAITGKVDNSVLGILSMFDQLQKLYGELHMSEDEVMAQVNQILFPS
ncbi:hypothetical protein PILCRDRAFT_79346 [Piloderma croceum F 1598]|uniref:Cytochrome P450 n=1 Tax=Piloderma croceum (strain F 1598) TaxID=765440 RepID=A0A0C3F5N0_PILCF|nr:hypothetical protein PILCRDRAFT_79346 [Piloderma croceum F 1598]